VPPKASVRDWSPWPFRVPALPLPKGLGCSGAPWSVTGSRVRYPWPLWALHCSLLAVPEPAAAPAAAPVAAEPYSSTRRHTVSSCHTIMSGVVTAPRQHPGRNPATRVWGPVTRPLAVLPSDPVMVSREPSRTMV
jgi:hypothetical protein